MPLRHKKKQGWKQNPQAVKADILRVATELFAAQGMTGTKIDDIAAQTATSKRMIYYYFGDKSGLYRCALEAAYARVREQEAELDLSTQSPDIALAQLVGFIFDNHRRNPDFVRMVMIENIQQARHLAVSEVIAKQNAQAIAQLSDVLARGQSSGVFRRDISAASLHWSICALSFFNVSNKPSYSTLFGTDLFDDAGQIKLRAQAVDMILGYARITPTAAQDAEPLLPAGYARQFSEAHPSD